VIALLGPNGAGKTTLFSLITRLFDALTGRIEIDGRSATDWGFRALGPLGVVFQQPTPDLDLTVKQNLRYFASLRNCGQTIASPRRDRGSLVPPSRNGCSAKPVGVDEPSLRARLSEAIRPATKVT